MTDQFFLGVDGGQSSTLALIGDQQGQVIGIGRAGPCNHVGAAEARAKFISVIGTVLKEAGSQSFESACLGFSGGAADKELILREIMHAKRLIVTDDAEIALSGATAGEPGVITISGTGSIALGQNGGGERARSGGWGYIFGDEGSSFDIVRRALASALRFEEGWGPATALRQMLLDATGAVNANDLLHRFYTPEFPRPMIASYAPLVDQAARTGDEEAIRILNDAARELHVIANAVARKLFGSEPVCVSYSGGTFRSNSLRLGFESLLRSGGDRIRAARFGPAAGALIMAYRSAGLNIELSHAPDEKTWQATIE